jgi:1,4-alpha-glucan branching enzyme
MYSVTTAVPALPALGATLFADQSGASFRVWAPNASAVNVLLSPNAAQALQPFPLSADPTNPGYWSAAITGVAAGHLYQFEITNRGGDKYDPGGVPFLRIDPAARQVQSSDRRVPGFVFDPTTFTWKASFPTPSFENFIIYQAHVGSFAGRGDGLPVVTDSNGSTASFPDVAAKLGYIRSMNFTAVQFLPNGEYRGSEGEAYNPSNYYAPESLYGSPDDLRRLIDACHEADLAVIFDVVYNHMDSTDNLWQFDGNTDHRADESDASSGGGIYFSTVDTGFGRRPDHDNPQVQRFFIDNASMCTPMLFMGSECHHYGYWDPDNDPFGDHRFDWTIAGDATGQPMRNLVTDVNALRWNNPALRSDSGPLCTHFDPDNRVLAFKRWNDQGNVLLIVVNLSDNQWDTAIYGLTVGGAGDRWSEILNSQSPQYGGWNDSGNYLASLWVGTDGKIFIRLPKWSVLIFKRQ